MLKSVFLLILKRKIVLVYLVLNLILLLEISDMSLTVNIWDR